ncbi:hypothetical protein [Sulfurimonas sp. HSL-1716]|uniref:2'-5' RNA ligase family protein n=1 Tax=Hydrocurvibacter sulfurireducens TaxID=3131937 RepID=UPI0031F97FF5
MNPLFLSLKAQLNDYEKIQSDFGGLVTGRWTPIENLHVTVGFFANKFSIEELLERVPPLLVPINSFKLCGLDYFTSNKIFYAKSESSELTSLVASLNDAFSLGGTKQFTAHVTLMRVKSVENKAAFEKMLRSYDKKELGRVDNVFELIQSHRHPNGANYECIKRF